MSDEATTTTTPSEQIVSPANISYKTAESESPAAPRTEEQPVQTTTPQNSFVAQQTRPYSITQQVLFQSLFHTF